MKFRELTREIAKVILAGSLVFCIWQIVSIAKDASEIDTLEQQVESAKADLTHCKNKMDMLEAEVKSKTGFVGGLNAFLEGFITGATFGLFDEEGLFGPVRREERWEKSVRDRAVEFQTGIDNANAKLEQLMNKHREVSLALPKKVVSRNASGAFAAIAILVLVFVPSRQERN